MERLKRKLMDGWEFAFNEQADKDFHPVILPHDWAIERPFNRNMQQGMQQGFRDRWGIGWYRRDLIISGLEKDKRYKLSFDGVFEKSTIWVNGQIAGENAYGYSGFTLDITNLLKEGSNKLLVKVDNTASPADRWYSGAGIYRTVTLLEVPENHLCPEDIQVTYSIKQTDAWVTIQTGKKDLVHAALFDDEIACSGESQSGTIQMKVPDVKLWSAAVPKLYNLNLLLYSGSEAIDEISLKIGFRDICMDSQKGMLVNGEPIKLKGVCIHQDAGCLGTAVPKEIWRERLLRLKEIGCNAIRAAHHIYAPEFLDLCDELGFYVYEECFDKWTGGAYGRYFEKEWEKDIACMVKRDRNHPCIFIWGVGNEVERQGQNTMLSILKRLREKILEYDATRPITYAMNPHFKKETNVQMSEVQDIQQFVDEIDETEIFDIDEKIERIKRISKYVDVIACNYQEQWYPQIHEAIPDKVILGTEIYEYFKGHYSQLQNFSEEIPWLDVQKYDYVIGGMIWTGIDYLGESMGYPAKGWSGALFRTNMQKKAIAYLYQSYWQNEPMVYFSVMDYSLRDDGVKEHWDCPRYVSHWEFPQFNKTVIPYMIASNCEEVELFLNDKKIYVKKPNECPNRMLTGYLPYLPGTVTVYGLNKGQKVCEFQVKTPGSAVSLQFDETEKIIYTKEPYTVLLTVKAVDQEGLPVFRESSNVRFTVEGNGEIIAVDNGDLMSSESYISSEMHMFRGQVSAAVRLTGEAGRVILHAYADGMYCGKVNIVVK